MNILHIVYAKVWGGGEQCVYNFCKAGQGCGHQNFIALDPLSTDIIRKFSEVAKVNPIALRKMKKWVSWKPFLQLIDTEKINILVCHSGTMAGFCAVLKKLRPQLKLVIYRHNVTPNKKDPYHVWLQRQADAFICVSKMVYDLQIKTACESCKYKFHLIYNGIDISNLTVRDLNYVPKPVFKIGYAGRIVANKGIVDLIYALKILREKYELDCELVLAGKVDGSFAKTYQSCTEKSGMEKFIKGPQFYTDMKLFYQNIDVFVLPTLVPESFGLVLCEAMYSGVPSISTNTGGQTEIIQDRVSGILIAPSQTYALAEQIAFLLQHAVAYQSIAREGHEEVKTRFTTQIMIEKINQLFSKL